MSHKIKILGEEQYSQLLAGKTNLGHEKIRLFLASVLPGLFYSASEKILNSGDSSFIYIPPKYLPDGFSFGSFKKAGIYNLGLNDNDITIDNNLFVPIISGSQILGGFYGHSDDFAGVDRSELIESFSLSEYLSHLAELDERPNDLESITVTLLDKISADKSLDSFMRSLPEWIVSTMGGGAASFYYRSGDCFYLRKNAGHLGEFGDVPAVIDETKAGEYFSPLEANQLFAPVGSVPELPMELNHPPLVRFILGGEIDNELGYILTGRVPNITSCNIVQFLMELRQFLTRLSFRHFSPISSWRHLLATLDGMIEARCTQQELSVFLFNYLNESMNINQLSLLRYYPLENRAEVEGIVASGITPRLRQKATIPISGTCFEIVIETGQSRFDELPAINLNNKILVQLYKEGVRSHLVLPLLTGNTIYGFLNIGSPMTGGYLNKYLAEFEAIARYLAKLHNSVVNKHKIDILSQQLEQLHDKFSAIENIRTLGELAGGVFHDLNNVIGAILGRSQLILQKTRNTPPDELIDSIAKDANVIERSALDSGEILNRLRQLAKSKKTEKKETVNLQELIDDSIEMVQPRWERLVQSSGLKITLKKEPLENIFVKAAASELREVFTNLLLNALDAMPDGGVISVMGRQFDQSAQVTISDTGTGIPPEILEKIFTPFFTTKGEKGTGLGLPLCKKIINDHRGTLDVRSVPDDGSTFIITLPIFERDDSTTAAEGTVSVSKPGLSILIAEDSPDLQATIFEMLTAGGYNVSAASSGEEVIRLCGRKRFDLLITDLGLPGISGLELADHIRRIDKNIKIILTSGWEIDESISDLMSRGIDSYLAKPFKTEEILKAIQDLLENKPVPSSNPA